MKEMGLGALIGDCPECCISLVGDEVGIILAPDGQPYFIICLTCKCVLCGYKKVLKLTVQDLGEYPEQEVLWTTKKNY